MNNEKELLKERYYQELERKDRFSDNLSFPTTMISLLIGALLYIVKNLSYINEGTIKNIFYFLFFCLIFSLIAAFYFLIKSTFNYDWQWLPLQKELKEDWDNLVEYYKDEHFKEYTDIQITSCLNNDFEDILEKHYRDSLEKNLTNNDSKAKYLHESYKCIILSIIFLALVSFPFFHSYNIKVQINDQNNNKIKTEFLKELKDLNKNLNQKEVNLMADNKPVTPQAPTKPQTVTTNRLTKNEGGTKAN